MHSGESGATIQLRDGSSGELHGERRGGCGAGVLSSLNSPNHYLSATQQLSVAPGVRTPLAQSFKATPGVNPYPNGYATCRTSGALSLRPLPYEVLPPSTTWPSFPLVARPVQMLRPDIIGTPLGSHVGARLSLGYI